MTALRVDGRRLKDLTPLRQGPARAGARGAQRRRRGDAPRRRRGARPRARRAAGRFRPRDDRAPEAVMRRARAAGFNVAPTGLAHGTVTLIVDGLPIEATTLRQDVETDGRHAKVAFGRDFAADARRRDFTINALSLSPTDASTIMPAASTISPRGACASSATPISASARTICAFCGSSAFRRASRRGATRRRGSCGGDPGARRPGAALARAGARGTVEAVRRAARRRRRARRWASAAFSGRSSAGSPIPDGSAACSRSRRRAASADPLLRLAALGVAIPEDAERLRERLRLSNAEYDRLAPPPRR